MKNIIIKHLELTNFKGIKDFKVDFSTSTSIYGANGTGKTTIADAIYWLLFDKDSTGRKDFSIKTLDKDGNAIHMLDHTVTASFMVDSTPLLLSKTFKEKWTKKRGEAAAVFSGHVTTYEIDNVPVKKADYQKKINELVSEDLFKLLTNPTYFSTSLNWKERRKILLDIVGDVTDEEICRENKELSKVLVLLGDKTTDELKASLVASKKKLNEKIKDIPARVDELARTKEEYDFEDLEAELQIAKNDLKEVEEKIADKSKVLEEELKKKEELMKLKSKYAELEFSLKKKSQEPLQELQKVLYEKDNEAKLIKVQISSKISQKEAAEKHKEEILKELDELRSQFREIKQKNIEFNEDDFKCPTCGRTFEEYDIEQKKNELIENFNKNKAKELEKNKIKGTSKKKLLDNYQENLAKLEEEISDLEIREENILKAIDATKTEINSFEPKIKYTEEYSTLEVDIKKLEDEINSSEEVDAADLKLEKANIQENIRVLEKKLFAKESNNKIDLRIDELKAEEKELNIKIAEIEGKEMLLDKFIKAKIRVLESKINSLFSNVTFKLFDIQINGGINEVCEPLVNGVPFSDANNASKINAGLDIINTLSKYYETLCFVILDNRESVTEIIDTKMQVINLFVDGDAKELTLNKPAGNINVTEVPVTEEERKEFKEKLETLRGLIGPYDGGGRVVDKLSTLFNDIYEYKKVIHEQNRWSVTTSQVFMVDNKFYIEACWQEPATESQEGQETQMEVYEVRPSKKVIEVFE